MVINSRWIVEGDALLIERGTIRITPEARQIFQSVFKGRKPADAHWPGNPADACPGLRFSRSPADLAIELSLEGENSGAYIQYSIIAEYGSTRQRVDSAFREADHVIMKNTWFPFAAGALDAVREILLQAGISSTDRLTLGQYLDIRRIIPNELIAIRDIPLERFRDDGNIRLASRPVTPVLIGELYPYQLRGVEWLAGLSAQSLGGILADEMGLGKTIQIIALLSVECIEHRAPSLIIAPSTLLENWRREFARFAPGLTCRTHHGQRRTGFPQELRNCEVVLTSYETAVRDLSLLLMIDWDVIVLDEAQNIKNPDAERTTAMKKLRRRVSIAATGTPIENHLSDLWSLADFVLPGYLGTLADFTRRYDESDAATTQLAAIVAPVILRRRVNSVADELPPKIDIPQPIILDGTSARTYEMLRQSLLEGSGERAHLGTLVRLRMLCCHPDVVDPSGQHPPTCSPKYERLVEILTEIVENGEKSLIFTSFTSMIDLFLADLPSRFAIYCASLDGRVPVASRQSIIDEFTAHRGPGILVLNPKAAGAGLNITAANHVIHYNPEWNPATEDQASARAYRRGQTRIVTVHRMFFVDTVEEVMIERLTRKRVVAETVIQAAGHRTSPDHRDLLRALRISPMHEHP